jgi:hypothetical protein
MAAACAARRALCSSEFVVVVAARIPKRLANLDRRDKMNCRERFILRERSIQFAAIPNVTLSRVDPI